MNTYAGNPGNKQEGKDIGRANQQEDLFLSGGFDSFGGIPEPINTGAGQLGSVNYGNGNAYGTLDNGAASANRWSEPKIILNLWGQLFNSFMPFRYDRYKGMSINAAKDFVKFFVKLYLITGYLVTFIMLLTIPGVLEYFKSGNITILLTVISFGITYAISAFIGPYFFRLQAFIYRVIFGNLIMAIEKKDINSTNMYLVSIYSCVPCMALGLPLGIFSFLLLNFSSALSFVADLSVAYAILELIMPIIIMLFAIPRME